MSQWKSPPPVVVLMGSYDYLRRREVREAVSVADAEGRTVEYLKGADHNALVQTLSTTGVLFQEKVLVVIDEPEAIDDERVLRHHNSGDNTVVLLLQHKGDVKAKSGLGKVCAGLPKRLVANFQQPKPWEMEEHAASFCVVEARKNGIALAEPLALALVRNVSGDLGMLSFEVRKLAFFLRSKGETSVTPAHLKQTLASFSQLGPKPVVEALERRDFAGTARALANMRRTHAGHLGGATMLACAWIGKSATSWLHVAALHEEGYKLEEISSRTGLHEFRVRKTFLPVARRWGQGRLRTLVNSIAGVERAVKSGHISPWIELESALFRAVEGSLTG